MLYPIRRDDDALTGGQYRQILTERCKVRSSCLHFGDGGTTLASLFVFGQREALDIVIRHDTSRPWDQHRVPAPLQPRFALDHPVFCPMFPKLPTTTRSAVSPRSKLVIYRSRGKGKRASYTEFIWSKGEAVKGGRKGASYRTLEEGGMLNVLMECSPSTHVLHFG